MALASTGVPAPERQAVDHSPMGRPQTLASPAPRRNRRAAVLHLFAALGEITPPTAAA
jgi:hypothetical protein